MRDITPPKYFFKTSLESLDQFLIIFDGLTQKTSFLRNIKIYRSRGPNFEKTLNILRCFFEKKNFFYEWHKTDFFFKMRELTPPKYFFKTSLEYLDQFLIIFDGLTQKTSFLRNIKI
jgi:hypothetical protein